MNLFCTMCMLLLFGAARSQKTHELTVKEAVDLAYKNVVELKNAQIDYRIQEAKNKEILGQALPQVRGNMTANHYLQVPQFLFPNATPTQIYTVLKEEGVSGANGPITKVPPVTFQQVSFQQPWNIMLSATVEQLLFQPDVFVGLQARQTALDLSDAQVEQMKETIKDSAYKRYYAILIAEKQLHFINESVQRLEKLYHDDSVMYKNGFAEKLDLDKVQVQLTNVRTTQSWMQNSIQLAYAALKFALGLPQHDSIRLKDDLTTANIKENILDNDFQYNNRPEIKTLGYYKKLQELDMKRYQLGYLPTVSLSGSYATNGMGPDFFTHESTIWLKSSFIGLNVNLTLFDGLQRKNKIQQAQLNVQKAENSIERMKQVIDLEQFIAKESLKNALLSLDMQERNLELAEKVYNTTKIKFEQGLGSSFEVLQADADYQASQSNYFTALYNAIITKTSYLKSLGRLE